MNRRAAENSQSTARRTDAAAAARVVVHAPNWVGDHAMAFPFYAALRDLLPGATIVLIGRSWIADLAPDGYASVKVFQGKSPTKADAEFLRAQNFDLGFTLSPSFRSAFLLLKLGVKKRYGFASDWRSLLLSRERNKFRRQPYNRHEHRALAFLRLLAPILPAGVLAEDLWEKYRHIKLPPLPFETVERKFGLRSKTRRVVICPGSTAASKKYPVGHFIRMIETVAQKIPAIEFVLLGAKIDRAECEAIAAHFAGSRTRLRSLCGETSLRETHTIIAGAQVAVANDSGLAHVTSLTGTALVVFNGMGRAEETSPLTRRKILLDLQLECSPCFARECPRKDFPLACLTGIAPDTAAAAVLQSL